MGSARFTIMSPVCVRLEYSTTGTFVDAPSLFAVQRGRGSRIVGDGGADVTVIETGALVVRYRGDGRGFTADNLE